MGSKNDDGLGQYVAENIDRALQNGWIQVYFQPVVRALTGKLSSVEALTRWIDPVRGVISPGVYIPVLEETKQIQKVDLFVIDHVAHMLREKSDNGEFVVPVSFNLSRVDFAETDPYKATEDCVAKYGINRKLLKVEITESTLISDPDKLHSMFGLFHDQGYDIWMDDFGSGYSTLNVLKDYSFDEIKIDMMFLRGLNDRGRNIVASIVRMAKSLGIHTLTEGAETREQVDFLKKIGCEKIQGYFYGAPMPYDTLVQHCADFGLVPESADEAYVYDAAGSIDFLSDQPIVLVEEKDSELKVIFYNDKSQRPLEEIARSMGLPDGSVDIFNKKERLYEKFIRFLDITKKNCKGDVFNFVSNGQYYRFLAKTLAGIHGRYMHLISLYNITYDITQKEKRRFNNLLRETTQIYSRICLISPHEDRIEVIETDDPDEKTGDVYFRIRNRLHEIADRTIAEDDRDRFVDFFVSGNISKTMKRVGSNFTGECFRVKRYDGTFHWDEFDVLSLMGSNDGDYLVLQRRAALDDAGDPISVINRIDDSFHVTGRNDLELYDKLAIWRSVADNSRIKFFWKDDERRFKGVSQSFLDYYGLPNADGILGKTDDEIGWHVDDEPYRDDELEVLRHGRHIVDSIGHTVVNGEIRLISATKLPIYRADRVIGLVGYFHQIDDSDDLGAGTEIFSDRVTSLMNTRGMLLTSINYYDNYKRHGEKFTVGLIQVEDKVTESMEEISSFKDTFYQWVSDVFKATFPKTYVCGRIDDSRFMIITKENPSDVRKNVFSLYTKFNDTKKINGVDVDLVMTYSLLASDDDYRPEDYLQVLEKRRTGEESAEYASGADRIVMNLENFDNMNERVYFADIENYDLMFLNRAAKRDLGLPDNFNYKGLKCYKVIHLYDHPCDHCTNPMVCQDRYLSHNYHNQITGQDYLMRDTLMNFGNRMVKASFSVSLTESIRQVEDVNNSLYRQVRVNDLISQIFEEKTPDESLNRILSGVGSELHADRAYIFEINGSIVTNTYEWVKKGVTKQIDNLKEVPIADVGPFFDSFENNNTLVIRDVEEYKGTAMYDWLKPQDIHSLIETPLRIDGQLIGFIGTDNPDMEGVSQAENMLISMARFVSVLIRWRNIQKELDDVSQRDELTNVMNRRALRTTVDRIDRNRILCVIYADLNYLKEVNDSSGHDSGDALIRSAANIMTAYAGHDRVFRMGGDEFVIVIELNNISQADLVMSGLRARFEKENISVALGCALRTSPDDDIDDILKEADEHMYANKKKMHADAER
ncbi:MAG: EAL domain-containing protein [Lachnospiraceae bacterium]|nr:EAL domain-containing protein [Lachnospiraceae bacterium]